MVGTVQNYSRSRKTKLLKELLDKINERMDLVQSYMEGNIHIADPQTVIQAIENVSKFWTVLSEEDRDYLQVARDAVDERQEWT